MTNNTTEISSSIQCEFNIYSGGKKMTLLTYNLSKFLLRHIKYMFGLLK